jgi:hypothetical protein
MAAFASGHHATIGSATGPQWSTEVRTSPFRITVGKGMTLGAQGRLFHVH